MLEPEPVSMEYVSQNLSGSFTSYVSLIDDSAKDESSLSHSNIYFGFGNMKLSQSHIKIVQAIRNLFDSWESWQKRMFYAGLINRFSQSQLNSLSVAVESVFHRDFLTGLNNEYPMRKLDQPLEQQEVYKQISKYFAHQRKEISKFRKRKSHAELRNVDDPEEFVYKSIFPPIELNEVPRPTKSITMSNSSSSDEEIRTIPKEPSPRRSKPFQTTFEDQRTSSEGMTSRKKAEIKKVSSLTSALPSLYTFANSTTVNDDTESELVSRVSQVDVEVEDFFPPKETTKLLGRVCTTKSKAALGKFMTRFDAKRNKLPCPTSKQLYKNEKFWSDQHRIVKTKTLRLKELFRNQIFNIWEWLSDWEEYKRVRLLIHLLSFSTTPEVKFVASCIKRKLNENAAQEHLAQILPEECWMEIFEHLDVDDVTAVGQVCKSWHGIAESENIWKTKCHELALRFGMNDFVEKMEANAAEKEPLDWKETYFELRRRLRLRKEAINTSKKQRKHGAPGSPDENVFTDSSDYSDTEKNLHPEKRKENRTRISKRSKTRRRPKDNLSSPDSAVQDLVSYSGSFEFLAEHQVAKQYVPFWKARKAEENVAVKKKRKYLKKYTAPEMFAENSEGEEIADKTDDEAFKLASKSMKKVHPDPPKPVTAKKMTPDLRSKTVSDSLKDSRRASQVEMLPTINKNPLKSKSSGFLQIWKSITEVVMEAPEHSAPQSATRKFEIDLILTQLLSDGQVENMAKKKDEYFAVDHHMDDELDVDLDFPVLPVKKVIAMQGHRGAVLSVLSHGEKVISGGLDTKIRLWHLNGDCFGTMDQEMKGGVVSLAIGADSKCKTLYAGSWDYSVSVFDSLSFKRIDMLAGHSNTVSGLGVDGHYIVSCSFDGTIRIWCIHTHQCLRILQVQHSNKAIHCMSYDNRTIITGGADKLVRMTNVDTGLLLRTFRGHSTYVSAIKRKGNLIISGDFEGNLLFWAIDGPDTPKADVKGHKSQINEIAFYRSRFFTASDDKLVKEWDIKSRQCVRILQGHTMAVTGVKCTEDYLVTCSKDGSVRMWYWRYF